MKSRVRVFCKAIRFYFENVVNSFAALLALGIAIHCTQAILRHGDNVSANLQDVFIAATVSISLFVCQQYVVIYSLVRRFVRLEGGYEGYSYQLNGKDDAEKEGYNKLDGKSISSATLTYSGGSTFLLELWNPSGKKSEAKYIWKGELTFAYEVFGELSFEYTKPASLHHSVGYKKVVVSKENGIRLYMFSTDGQRFGREVLVRQ